VRKDAAEMLRLVRLAAAQDECRALTQLGIAYQHGRGVECDVEEAFRLFKRAAEKGDCHASANLAICYLSGAGVEQDIDEARRWVAKAESFGFVHIAGLRADVELGAAMISGDEATANRIRTVRNKDFVPGDNKVLIDMFICSNPSCKAVKRCAVLSKCGGCRLAAYCDRNCQREHWSSHKAACKAAQAEAEAKAKAEAEAEAGRGGGGGGGEVATQMTK